MICILAMIVFGVLAIFSAKYRPLAAEAFDCVFRRVTFRKCTSGLDKRLKSQITGKFMKKSPKIAKFTYKYFEVISWIFLILLFASIFQTGLSIYNYAVYGNCNGPDESGFCIFDPLGNNQPKLSESGICVPETGSSNEQKLTPPNYYLLSGSPRLGSASASVKVIEFGCFTCPNTAKQAPDIKKLIKEFGTNIEFIYVNFPISTHPLANETAIAGHCVFKQDPKSYWKFYFSIFEIVEDEKLSLENIFSVVKALNVDFDEFNSCFESEDAKKEVDNLVDIAVSSGIYGTPSFFINNQTLVGVKPFKLLKSKINEELEKS